MHNQGFRVTGMDAGRRQVTPGSNPSVSASRLNYTTILTRPGHYPGPVRHLHPHSFCLVKSLFFAEAWRWAVANVERGDRNASTGERVRPTERGEIVSNTTLLTGKNLAEYASDIQTGIGAYEVGDFDELRMLGMAASLAVQLRGLPEIGYQVPAKVSDSLFNIPTVALKPVLRTLSEVGMVRLYESGKTITKIDPDVPYFESVYDKIGDYSAEFSFNETEQAMVAIMSELQKTPSILIGCLRRLEWKSLS
jgi:hypothetical protein